MVSNFDYVHVHDVILGTENMKEKNVRENLNVGKLTLTMGVDCRFQSNSSQTLNSRTVGIVAIFADSIYSCLAITRIFLVNHATVAHNTIIQ